MMNKCTLLIDGNWLLMSRVHVMTKGFKMSNDEWEKEKSTQELEELMVRSINIVLNRFVNVVDNIILITDGGSWRKQLPKPFLMKDDIYKGNRVQTEELDWHYIYKSLNNIQSRFNELGITCCHDSNIEGDDWVWYWSRRLNDEGINTIIWSSDNDLKQLVQVKNFAFTAWYNDKNGLFLHNSLKTDVMDDLDFFMTQEKESPTLKTLKKLCEKYNYIDPMNIITSKIVCGDAGDNIKSLIRIKKGSRNYKVGEKEWENCKDSIGIDTLETFFENRDNIIDTLLSSSKYSGCCIDRECIMEMFDYNTKLVWLDEKVIPNNIVYCMNECEYKNYDLSYIRNNFKVMLQQDNSIEKLFDGI